MDCVEFGWTMRIEGILLYLAVLPRPNSPIEQLDRMPDNERFVLLRGRCAVIVGYTACACLELRLMGPHPWIGMTLVSTMIFTASHNAKLTTCLWVMLTDTDLS